MAICAARCYAFISLLCSLALYPLPLEGARSDGSLILDGLQGDYAPSQPATPGYVFVTPARAAGSNQSIDDDHIINLGLVSIIDCYCGERHDKPRFKIGANCGTCG